MHMGGGKAVENAITDLGLFYSLLTPFTSFVAIDSQVVNRGGQSDTVRQPLPMPEGVSNYAVAQPSVRKMKAPMGAAGNNATRYMSAKPMSAPMAAEMAAAPEPMMAPAPAPARPRAVASSVAKRGSGQRASLDDLASVKKEAESAGRDKDSKRNDKGKACKVSVKIGKADGAGDTQALRKLVMRTARAVACSSAGSIRLGITLDKTGKITKVEVLSGDAGTGQALVRKLTSATSATRATEDKATVEVTITVGS
jgi:hypothetical protein